MGKIVGQELDVKSNLVSEICGISRLYSKACIHTKQLRQSHSKSSTFIDWYRLLGIEESAGLDVIRKRYHKLALQLHPDKNKHPKADIAFKLVSEAHACLSDATKRRAFDLERWKNFCFQCNSVSPSRNSSKHKSYSTPSNKSKSYKFIRGLRDIRDKFREETKVIEKCLKANSETKEKESYLFDPSDCLLRSASYKTSHKESPIFNPSDYSFGGYPHIRNRVHKKPDNFWHLKQGNLLEFERRLGQCDSPIFEARSERRGILKSKSTCVHS